MAEEKVWMPPKSNERVGVGIFLAQLAVILVLLTIAVITLATLTGKLPEHPAFGLISLFGLTLGAGGLLTWLLNPKGFREGIRWAAWFTTPARLDSGSDKVGPFPW